LTRPSDQVHIWPGYGFESMNELIFTIEKAPEGGFTARALGVSIFTEADSLPQLRDAVRDAVRCHFDPEEAPTLRAILD